MNENTNLNLKKERKINQLNKKEETMNSIDKIYNEKSFTITKKKKNRKIIKIININHLKTNETENIHSYTNTKDIIKHTYTSSKDKIINNNKNNK